MEKCTENNEWCNVCGFDYTVCSYGALCEQKSYEEGLYPHCGSAQKFTVTWDNDNGGGCQGGGHFPWWLPVIIATPGGYLWYRKRKAV